MARPGLTQHRKFLRLGRLLGSAPLALGCLEFLWEKCYQNGDAYLGDEIDVEAAAQWPGESGTLCRSLLNAGGDGNPGFIEEVEGRPGHYQCHDLFDHAPRYVGRRLAKEIERQKTGTTLSQLRAEAGRKGGKSKKSETPDKQTDSKRTANGQQEGSKSEASGQQSSVTPAPAPAPAPSTSSLRSEDGTGPEVTLDSMQSVLTLWKELAEPAGLPAVLHLEGARKSHLKARLKERDWLGLFKEALTYAARHPEAAWMRGEGPRPWKADLDYFLKPGSVLKTVEKARSAGSGNPRASPPGTGPARRCATADADHRAQLAQMGAFPTLPGALL